MTYSISEVAERFNLSVYTLRYYDKAGLLPFVAKNKSGYREFTEADLNLIHTICCLKDTGMPIKDIRQYIEYCMIGTETIAQRAALLTAHKNQVLAEITKLNDNLAELDFKLAVYNNPEAVALVQESRDLTSLEKQQNDLWDPFADKVEVERKHE